MGYTAKSMGDFIGKFLLMALLIYFLMKVIASFGRLEQQGFA